MQISAHFDHVNFNVTDLDRSIEFYKKALGLEKTGEIIHPDGAFKIIYLSRPGEKFRLELRARSLKFRGRRGRSLGVDFVTCCKEHTEVCD